MVAVVVDDSLIGMRTLLSQSTEVSPGCPCHFGGMKLEASSASFARSSAIKRRGRMINVACSDLGALNRENAKAA
jgi:hypothetical protein